MPNAPNNNSEPKRRYIHAWAPSAPRTGQSGYVRLRSLTEQELKDLERKAFHA